MPAENMNMVNTNQLRFVSRLEEIPDAARTRSGLPPQPRVLRILQQRWVAIGTGYVDKLDITNSEWRDVPLVEGE